MNKIYLLLSLGFVVVISITGFLLFNNFRPLSSGVGHQRSLFEKIAANPKDIEKYKTEIQKLAKDYRPFVTISGCVADKPIIKLFKDENVVIKNSAGSVDLTISTQTLTLKAGENYQFGPFKPGVYIYECKDTTVSKKSGLLYVEDKYSSTYQTYLDSLDKVAQNQLALGLEQTLVEKLKIHALHDFTSKEFKDTLAWVRANAVETPNLALTNCLPNSNIIKVVNKQITIQNNDSSEVTVLMGDGPGFNIPANQSVEHTTILNNSVLTFSCGKAAGEVHEIGFVYYQ